MFIAVYVLRVRDLKENDILPTPLTFPESRELLIPLEAFWRAPHINKLEDPKTAIGIL